MTLRELAPWRWGGLRPSRSEDKPFGHFRSEMEEIQHGMDRLFEDFWHDAGRFPESRESWSHGGIVAHVNEAEDEKGYHITVELPGMDEKDVDVALSDGLLTIRGEKQEKKEEKDKDYFRRERVFGSFRRTLRLPSEVDESKIEASFKKGVLTINLPKTEAAQKKVKHITIKAA